MTKFDVATPATSLGAHPRPIAARDAGTFAVLGLSAVIIGSAALAYIMAPAHPESAASAQQTTIDASTLTDGYLPGLQAAQRAARTAEANRLVDGWMTRLGTSSAAGDLTDGWLTRYGAGPAEELVDGWSIRYLVTDED